VGELPPLLQPKLLRALQEREFDRLGDTRVVKVDIRVIATTNRPLEAMVKEGSFRGDLYYAVVAARVVAAAGELAIRSHHCTGHPSGLRWAECFDGDGTQSSTGHIN
jgi:sigma54-dependent transcription regulator